MTILLTAPYNDKERENLEEVFGEVIYRSWKPNGRAFNAQEVMDLLAESGADAYITEHDTVTKEVIDAYPNLEFIGVCRGTPSNVDIETASAHHIPVFHTPARNAQAVAEMFLANVITLMRNTLPAIDWLESESWEAGRTIPIFSLKEMNWQAKRLAWLGLAPLDSLLQSWYNIFPVRLNIMILM
jgi:D-3-phosphoglycerate dehydrogenase